MPGLRRELSSLQVMLLEMSEVYPKVSTQDSGNEASEFKGVQVWLTAGHPDVWSRAWTHALHHTPPVPAADRCLKCLITADEDAHVFSSVSPQTFNLPPRRWCVLPHAVIRLKHRGKKNVWHEYLCKLTLLVVVLHSLPLSRQVCVAAVGNTRQKAQEVCRLLGQSLGKPLLIREEETKEWGGHTDSQQPNAPDSQTLQERILNATAYASCRVFAVFEIKGKENRRKKLL